MRHAARARPRGPKGASKGQPASRRHAPGGRRAHAARSGGGAYRPTAVREVAVRRTLPRGRRHVVTPGRAVARSEQRGVERSRGPKAGDGACAVKKAPEGGVARSVPRWSDAGAEEMERRAYEGGQRWRPAQWLDTAPVGRDRPVRAPVLIELVGEGPGAVAEHDADLPSSTHPRRNLAELVCRNAARDSAWLASSSHDVSRSFRACAEKTAVVASCSTLASGRRERGCGRGADSRARAPLVPALRTTALQQRATSLRERSNNAHRCS